MDKKTLATARKDETFCGDDLIALAVDCKRQQRNETAGLTYEDAKIIQRRAPLCALNADGRYTSFSNDIPTLRYLFNLNA